MPHAWSRASLVIGIAVLAAAGAAPAARRNDVPRATPAGPPVDCLQIPQIRQTKVRDDRTIDFIVSGGRVYRNTLPNSCPELGFERASSYGTSLSQLCAVDIITVFRNAGAGPRGGASCGLGPFQPVTLAR